MTLPLVQTHFTAWLKFDVIAFFQKIFTKFMIQIQVTANDNAKKSGIWGLILVQHAVILIGNKHVEFLIAEELFYKVGGPNIWSKFVATNFGDKFKA